MKKTIGLVVLAFLLGAMAGGYVVRSQDRPLMYQCAAYLTDCADALVECTRVLHIADKACAY